MRGKTGLPITRVAILKLREELGPHATMSVVADYLGIELERLKKFLRRDERTDWQTHIRCTERLRWPGEAVAHVRAVAEIFGRTPTAKEAGLRANVLNYCGGYNRILVMAGMRIRRHGAPSLGTKRPRPKPAPEPGTWEAWKIKVGRVV